MITRLSALGVTSLALWFTTASAQEAAQPQPSAPAVAAPEAPLQPPAPVVLLIPAPMPLVGAAKPVVGYDKGFFVRTDDDKFSLKVNGRMHTLYAFVSKDGSPDEMSFSIATARLTLAGGALLPSLTYRFEMEIGKGNFIVYDVFTDLALIPKTLHLRAGMWKRPFARQFISATSRFETVEGSPANGYFGVGYDTGLALHNGYDKSPEFEWVVGVFNGRNTDKPWVKADPTKIATNATTSDILTNYPTRLHPMLVARVGYNHNGMEGYAEGDLDGGPLRLAAAANLAYDIDYDDDGVSALYAGADLMIKCHGASLGGAFYDALANAKGGDMEQKGLGGFLQAGYVVAKMFEPVARASVVIPKNGRSFVEVAAGLSIYFLKHNLKWQTLVSSLTNPAVLKGTLAAGSDTTDYTVKTQLVTAF